MTGGMEAAVDTRPSHAGSTGATLAVAVALLALPSAVLGFGTSFQTPRDTAAGLAAAQPNIAALRVDGSGARLARALSLSFLSRTPLYPFTPAKNPNRPDRSVTVAVRLDPQTLRTITVLGPRTQAPTLADVPVRIAQSGFNLGVARGYRTFSPEAPAPAPPVSHRDPADLAARYSLAPGGFGGREAARSRQLGPDRDDAATGGSYRVTRNIDLTAGQRSAPYRERLKPLTDANLDNQAVYVGTKFKF